MAKKFKFNIIKTIKTFLVLVCLFILSTVGKNVFIRHFFNERLTVIPNVVNLNEKDAVKYLKEAGLNVKLIQKLKKFHLIQFTYSFLYLEKL